MFEWAIGHWQEWLISLIAILAYRQIRTELDERHQGEKRLAQKVAELDQVNASLQKELHDIKDCLVTKRGT
jgi:hypothetical protein